MIEREISATKWKWKRLKNPPGSYYLWVGKDAEEGENYHSPVFIERAKNGKYQVEVNPTMDENEPQSVRPYFKRSQGSRDKRSNGE